MGHREHDLQLERIIKDLSIIDEDNSLMEFMMIEGMLYRDGQSNDRDKLCDIVAGYVDNEGVAIELKRSEKGRTKGCIQLNNGEYLLNRWGYNPIRKKLVYYGGDKLKYELIEPVYTGILYYS